MYIVQIRIKSVIVNTVQAKKFNCICVANIVHIVTVLKNTMFDRLNQQICKEMELLATVNEMLCIIGTFISLYTIHVKYN